MALFVFNSRRYEMLMYVCFTCLCNWTHRKLRCVGNFNRYIYLPTIRAHRGNASVFAALYSRAPGQSSTAGTECHTVLVGSRFQLQETIQLALDLVASPAPEAYVERLFSLCGDLTARKRNSTKVSLCRRVFLKLNRHILH